MQGTVLYFKQINVIQYHLLTCKNIFLILYQKIFHYFQYFYVNYCIRIINKSQIIVKQFEALAEC